MGWIMRSALATIALAAAIPAFTDDQAAIFTGIDAMPPAERFRQLSLMLMVTDGTDQALVDTLSARLGEVGDEKGQTSGPGFDFDQYSTPLIRIVDQQTMLAGATQLFRFTREHAPEVAARLKAAQQAMLEERGAPTTPAIAEDAIIIRNAIADSIDYEMHGSGEEGEKISAGYRARTVYLRNNLEYELFAVELDRITAEAVASVGGQSDAYQRMFDEEVDSEELDKKIKAAEYAYGWDRKFDERAAKMAEEILNNIWDRESGMDP